MVIVVLLLGIVMLHVRECVQREGGSLDVGIARILPQNYRHKLVPINLLLSFTFKLLKYCIMADCSFLETCINLIHL